MTTIIIQEWDFAMRQARELVKIMPEFKSHSREELLNLANAIFIRNAEARTHAELSKLYPGIKSMVDDLKREDGA